MPECERARRVEAQTENWADPGYKALQSAALSAGQQSRPEAVERRERTAYLEQLRSVPCMDCGGVFPAVVMDFDHVPERGEKLFGLGGSDVGRTMAELRAETAKCDVVCANCHRLRTVARARGNDS